MRHFVIAGPDEVTLQYLADALNRVDVSIILLDRNMRVRFANCGHTAMFGESPELLATGPQYRDLVAFVCCNGSLTVPPDQVDDFVNQRVEAVRVGFAERLRSQVEADTLVFSDRVIEMTISVGLRFRQETDRHIENLIARAVPHQTSGPESCGDRWGRRSSLHPSRRACPAASAA